MPPSADRRPTQLVLRALHLGDLLVAVPALRALRRARPDHRLVLAAPAALGPLAALTGAVDALLPTDTPDDLRWPGPAPEVAVNLHGAGPQSHAALDRTGPRVRIGFAAPGWDGPAWDDDDRVHERERWCAMVAAHGVPADPADLRIDPPDPGAGPGGVLVHPGARYGAKRWPPARFAEVAATLARAGRRVRVTGSAPERPLAADVARRAGLDDTAVLAGATSLPELCALVAAADLVVCGDTGIAHVASALGTPSVVLFGPVPPSRWGPPTAGPHRVLTAAGDRRGDPFADDPDPALLGVPVGEVLGAADALLHPPGGPAGSPGTLRTCGAGAP
ncbi:MAG: glycosyltransferase family 9 protein [Pseudonocardiales bacterium]|nr:glycosyltransferase family 9 protein [Pseudonocardiales bacterium]